MGLFSQDSQEEKQEQGSSPAASVQTLENVVTKETDESSLRI